MTQAPAPALTDDELAIVREMLAAGSGIDPIAERLGRGRRSTRRLIREAGFVTRAKTRSVQEEVRKLILERPGRHNVSIAAEVGCHRDTVADVRRALEGRKKPLPAVKPAFLNGAPGGRAWQFHSLTESELALVAPEYLQAARETGVLR